MDNIQIFYQFVDNIDFILQKFYSPSLKCGLSAIEGIVLVTLNRNENFKNYYNEDIFNSLENKGLIIKNDNFSLTSKGKIVSKSIENSL